MGMSEHRYLWLNQSSHWRAMEKVGHLILRQMCAVHPMDHSGESAHLSPWPGKGGCGDWVRWSCFYCRHLKLKGMSGAFRSLLVIQEIHYSHWFQEYQKITQQVCNCIFKTVTSFKKAHLTLSIFLPSMGLGTKCTKNSGKAPALLSPCPRPLCFRCKYRLLCHLVTSILPSSAQDFMELS